MRSIQLLGMLRLTNTLIIFRWVWKVNIGGPYNRTQVGGYKSRPTYTFPFALKFCLHHLAMQNLGSVTSWSHRFEYNCSRWITAKLHFSGCRMSIEMNWAPVYARTVTLCNEAPLPFWEHIRSSPPSRERWAWFTIKTNSDQSICHVLVEKETSSAQVHK